MGASRYDDSDRLEFLIDHPRLTVMRMEATVCAALARRAHGQKSWHF